VASNMHAVAGTTGFTLAEGLSALTSVSETTPDKHVKVYPNPATNQVFFEFSERIDLNVPVSIDLYSTAGAKLETIPVRNGRLISLDLPASMPSGLYLYVVHSDEEYYLNGKLIKQ
jgi:hypothetical protein